MVHRQLDDHRGDVNVRVLQHLVAIGEGEGRPELLGGLLGRLLARRAHSRELDAGYAGCERRQVRAASPARPAPAAESDPDRVRHAAPPPVAWLSYVLIPHFARRRQPLAGERGPLPHDRRAVVVHHGPMPMAASKDVGRLDLGLDDLTVQ